MLSEHIFINSYSKDFVKSDIKIISYPSGSIHGNQILNSQNLSYRIAENKQQYLLQNGLSLLLHHFRDGKAHHNHKSNMSSFCCNCYHCKATLFFVV